MTSGYLWRRGRILLLVVAACLAGRAEFPPTVWDGIYTDSQAQHGAIAYHRYCASCHGLKLEGTFDGPSLVGSDFEEDWDLTNVGELVDEIQLAMPANRPGQLSAETNAAILAYILKANKFPAGSKALPAGADPLRGIVFAARRFGPQSSRTAALFRKPALEIPHR
jgi:mono/diheme cytochrome c family protein